MSAFLRSMAAGQLQQHHISVGRHTHVTFSTAAMTHLARCCQLQDLSIDVGISASERSDWRCSRVHCLHAGLSPLPQRDQTGKRPSECCSCRRYRVCSSTLRVFRVDKHDKSPCISCHPAVLLATIGGYCEHIERLLINDEGRYEWSNVQVADVVGAYQSAVTAAGRGGAYKPFTQLKWMRVGVCWCTPPSVWHALLSLMRHAVRLHCLYCVQSNDPLVVASLAHLPAITSLKSSSWWPASFATFVTRKDERTGCYPYLQSEEVSCKRYNSCPGPHTSFSLFESVEGFGEAEPTSVTPASHPFTAYQRSLTADQQALLVRWATGDYRVRAGDEQLDAADSPSLHCEEKEDDAATDRPPCGHAHDFSWIEARQWRVGGHGGRGWRDGGGSGAGLAAADEDCAQCGSYQLTTTHACRPCGQAITRYGNTVFLSAVPARIVEPHNSAS